jgi:hypothetical protein
LTRNLQDLLEYYGLTKNSLLIWRMKGKFEYYDSWF